MHSPTQTQAYLHSEGHFPTASGACCSNSPFHVHPSNLLRPVVGAHQQATAKRKANSRTSFAGQNSTPAKPSSPVALQHNLWKTVRWAHVLRAVLVGQGRFAFALHCREQECRRAGSAINVTDARGTGRTPAIPASWQELIPCLAPRGAQVAPKAVSRFCSFADTLTRQRRP